MRRKNIKIIYNWRKKVGFWAESKKRLKNDACVIRTSLSGRGVIYWLCYTNRYLIIL
nr:MAG TPA: hypothetical protein [Caudoviricetes sp.]